MSDPIRLQTAGRVLQALFPFVRVAQMHGAEHPAMAAPIEALRAALTEAAPPLSLQFAAGAVFRDRVLLPLTRDEFQRATQLDRAFSQAGVQEITFEQVPEASALRALGRELAEPQPGRLEELHLTAMRFRAIAQARFGSGQEKVESETFVAAQLALAIESVGQALDAQGNWVFSHGLAATRRVEQALEADASATLRAIEEMNAGWSPGRFAVSAALTVAPLLKSLDASRGVCRAALHATLAVTLCGFRNAPRGIEPAEAAKAALAAMVAQGKLSVDSHRLRTLALLQQASMTEASTDDLAALPAFAYALERRRQPSGTTLTLMRQDVLAAAANGLGRWAPVLWGRLLIAQTGVFPPGSKVRLADGRTATVLGPSSQQDPRRPSVMIDGRRFVPEAPVELLGPGARHG